MSRGLVVAVVLASVALATTPPAVAQGAAAVRPALASAVVQADGGATRSVYDGVVEAVRQSAVSAQVAGAILALPVKAGERVKAGQLIARIDARTAEQNAAASTAQVHAAQAMLDAAQKDYERQRQLYEKRYISLSGLERSQSQFKSAKAQAAAQLAQARAASTQSGLHEVRAPYAGIVAQVPVALGDMALPGKTLAVIYEPGALRVTAAVPQSALSQPLQDVEVELPGLGAAQRWFAPTQVLRLPVVDASTHTVQLRADLPAGIGAVAPGMFARLSLAGPSDAAARLYVPASAIWRRGELNGVYVLDDRGVPLLRQVRLGRADGERIEVLTGVSAGERVALDPQAAARVRPEERSD